MRSHFTVIASALAAIFSKTEMSKIKKLEGKNRDKELTFANRSMNGGPGLRRTAWSTKSAAKTKIASWSGAFAWPSSRTRRRR